jgi:hypothetical protein
MRYKITCLFFPDWNNMVTALFGSAVPASAEYGGANGEFVFDAPVTVADLGPLVKVETLSL